MISFKSSIFLIVTASTLTLQSCAMTQVSPEPEAKQIVLERWNRCLERFPAKATKYCDGHKRDVISVYPGYMEEQLNARLSRQAYTVRAQRMVKTALGAKPIRKNLIILDNLIASGDKAREGDL